MGRLDFILLFLIFFALKKLVFLTEQNTGFRGYRVYKKLKFSYTQENCSRTPNKLDIFRPRGLELQKSDL